MEDAQQTFAKHIHVYYLMSSTSGHSLITKLDAK